MIPNLKKIKIIFADKGLKPTFQRLAIYNFLDKNRIHPNADIIYDKIVKKIPTISRTTVYNTMKLFIEKGLIQELTITGTESCFDIDMAPHHHFYCKICSKVYDIKIQCPYGYDHLNNIDGNKIEEVHGYFKGICHECLDKPN